MQRRPCAAGGGRNPVYHGTRPARGREGQEGTARRFNGEGDYLDLSRALCPPPANTAVAVSAWIEPGKPEGVVLAHGGASWGYCLHLAGGRAAFSTRVSDTLTTVTAPDELPRGWAHVRGVLGGKGTMRLFVNDELVASGKAPGLLTQNPHDNLQVGVDRGSAILAEAGGFYGGLIDEVLVEYGVED